MSDVIQIEPGEHYKVKGATLIEYRELKRVLSAAPRVCVFVDEAPEGWPFMCGMDEFEEVHHPAHGHKPEMAWIVRDLPVSGFPEQGDTE